ncbi:LLM class flavin-dependent oxidoreductase [Streptomyces sp. NPDC047725]|uniref:LLM class flavin-dependent oxidoreductase n=1 Tax=Streptomyces sp. NPDC047725 TaxID=3365487 RepID=UPI00371A99CD
MGDRALKRLGFLTIGLFDEADPGRGHEDTLRMLELGERLGYDSAWVRHRHLQYGIASPVAVLAAATQRTGRIELGTAVTPLGWENPLRLAEDWATVDILSGGRLNPGVSTGPPAHYERVRGALYPDTGDAEEFGHARVRRLLDHVAGEPVTDFRGTEGIETYSDRVQPHSPGLRQRMWYGGGSLRSARWAGENTMNLLTSSVVKAEGTEENTGAEDFAAIQLSHIRAFRAAHPHGEAARVSQGLVVIPTDSADAAQRAWYGGDAARRLPRTRRPQGPARLLFAPDLVGPSEQIAERLRAHAAFREVDEVAFALPFTFAPEDYEQILTDIAGRLGPALGWRRAD